MANKRHDRIMKTFGVTLKTARLEAGFSTATSFAEEMGVEPHTYRKYERGQSEPNFELLVRICNRLKISANDLLPESRIGKDGSSASIHRLHA